MRILLFSDLHLDARFSWAPAEVARKRRRALQQTLANIAELVDEAEVDLLCCGGDLYEQERFTPDTMAFVRQLLSDIDRPVFIAPGNHDWYGPKSLYAQVDWPEHVHIFTEESLTPVVLDDGLTLWGGGHQSPANADGFFDGGFSVDREGIHLALFHGAERGGSSREVEGKEPYAPFAPHQIEAAGVHHAMLGHFHTPRDAERHTYPGNPDPLTFGEEGSRGAVILEVGQDGSVRRERRTVSASNVHDLRFHVSRFASSHDLIAGVTEQVQQLSGSVRVILHGTIDPDVEFDYRSLTEIVAGQPTVDGVVVKADDVHVGYDLEALAEEATIRGQFIRDVRASDHDVEQQRRIIVTGLRAMDERDDLEVL